MSSIGTEETTRISLPLSGITRDPRCQSRVDMNTEVIDDYAEAMQGGATSPPITVFTDGATHLLADGFHRFAAAERAGLDALDAVVRQGGIRDAEMYALGVNDTHGLRRTRADKRRSVERALQDAELATWTDNAIAKQCSVSHHFVASVRASLGTNQETQRTYRDRWGNVSTMDVSQIGKSQDDETVKEPVDTGDLAATIRRLIIHHGRDQVATTTATIVEEMRGQGWQ